MNLSSYCSKRLQRCCLIAYLLIFSNSCGNEKTNYLSSSAPKSQQELAELDMEKGSTDSTYYVSAQERLEGIIASDPTNYKAYSLLSASHAAQANVVLLSIVTESISQSSKLSGGGGSSSAISYLTSIIPEATDTNIAKMKLSTEWMKKIPSDQTTSDMKFQSGIFQAIYASLILKKLQDLAKNLQNITPEQVTELLGVLAEAASTLGQGSSPIAAALTSVKDGITNAPGETSSDKIKNMFSGIQVPVQ